jgi:hypothetical protein
MNPCPGYFSPWLAGAGAGVVGVGAGAGVVGAGVVGAGSRPELLRLTSNPQPIRVVTARVETSAPSIERVAIESASDSP